MKGIFCLLLSVFFLVQSSFAISLPKPTAEFFVNDFANVIDAEDEQAIFNMAKSLYESSGNSTQVVVVTIDSLDGNSLEEYANELFNQWGIGSKENDDGVLLLLAVNDRESRIEVGYGLEGTLTDGKTGRIQDDYMIPYYRDNDFSEGLKSGVEAIVGVVNGTMTLREEQSVPIEYSFGVGDFILIPLFVLVGIVVIIVCMQNVDSQRVKVCEKCGGKKFQYRKRYSGKYIYTFSECLMCGKVYTRHCIISNDYYINYDKY